MERSGTSAHAVYAFFSHFYYVGGFVDLGDPVLPTLRGASRDVETVYAYYDTKGRFLRPIASSGPVMACEKMQKDRLCILCSLKHFCYVGVFGDLSDRGVPTLRGASGDVVKAYAT